METAIFAGMFILVALLIGEGYVVARAVINPEARQARSRLRVLAASPAGAETVEIVKKKTLSRLPWLNRVLAGMPSVKGIERLLEQADSPWPAGYFILLTVMLALAALTFLRLITGNGGLALLGGAAAGCLPFFHLSRKKKERIKRMEQQLPDAMDLVARSLKAGHAFTGGLKMVAEEFPAPAGPEFGKTMDEINFGVGVPEALKNLTNRVECPDLRFFAVSVIVQRETGGNLAEILENIGRLIRQRFKLQGTIRALSADGRLTAVILIILPFLFFGITMYTTPQYVGLLLSDPIGHVFIGMAFFLMAAGTYIIKKMISFGV